MATGYKINGTATEIGPVSVIWRALPFGLDHNGQTLYSAFHEIEMKFDGGSVTHAREWLSASTGSINLTTLNKWGLTFTDLSGVYLEITDFPPVEDVNVGEFTILVRGVTI